MSDRTPTIGGREAWDASAVTVARIEKMLSSCPECQSGKCFNCDGTTWDLLADAETECPCHAMRHEA